MASKNYRNYRNSEFSVMSTKIPKGWLDCPEIASGLIDDLFLCFKVPLSSRYNHKIAPEDRHSTAQCLGQCRRHHVGLWIDLTDTDRYYHPHTVTDQNIEFIKISVHGGGSGKLPHFDTVQRFIDTVSAFRERCPHDRIAVHCTHGFNRTGYLICSYLAHVNRMSIAGAIHHFAEQRYPGIYRQEYIDHLLATFGSKARILSPSKPHWAERHDIPAIEQAPGQQYRSYNSLLSITDGYRGPPNPAGHYKEEQDSDAEDNKDNVYRYGSRSSAEYYNPSNDRYNEHRTSVARDAPGGDSYYSRASLLRDPPGHEPYYSRSSSIRDTPGGDHYNSRGSATYAPSVHHDSQSSHAYPGVDRYDSVTPPAYPSVPHHDSRTPAAYPSAPHHDSRTPAAYPSATHDPKTSLAYSTVDPHDSRSSVSYPTVDHRDAPSSVGYPTTDPYDSRSSLVRDNSTGDVYNPQPSVGLSAPAGYPPTAERYIAPTPLVRDNSAANRYNTATSASYDPQYSEYYLNYSRQFADYNKLYNPQSIPQSVPQTAPQSAPQTIPQTVPQTAPENGYYKHYSSDYYRQ